MSATSSARSSPGAVATPAARRRSASHSAPFGATMASCQPARIFSELVVGVDQGDHMHGHLSLFLGPHGGMEPPEGVLDDVRRRLPHQVQLAGVLHPVDLVRGALGIVPIGAQLDLCGRTAPWIAVVELLDIHWG